MFPLPILWRSSVLCTGILHCKCAPAGSSKKEEEGRYFGNLVALHDLRVAGGSRDLDGFRALGMQMLASLIEGFAIDFGG
jgi:hypothetical protein